MVGRVTGVPGVGRGTGEVPLQNTGITHPLEVAPPCPQWERRGSRSTLEHISTSSRLTPPPPLPSPLPHSVNLMSLLASGGLTRL